MAEKIPFDLVSPERLLLSEDAEMVTLPGTEGDLGVLAGHEPLITTLRPGVIEVKGGARGDERFFVMGGFADIGPAKLTVLAEEAFPIAGVDVAAVDQRIADTKEDLLVAKTELERSRLVATLDALNGLRAAL
ncbi:MAG TPA: F0F1 ATP synthase subunit epsilon [Rhizomicrobium sp.]|jgi:F-type H+-transporting ATPase subunit epsilon|nr:F0F1 ATP synthase subunit epsilon [Rhizomicrobium sp.]